MTRITATKVFAAACACLVCSLLDSGAQFVFNNQVTNEPTCLVCSLLASGTQFVSNNQVTNEPAVLDQDVHTDSLNLHTEFRMVLRVLSVMILLLSASRYVFFQKSMARAMPGTQGCGTSGKAGKASYLSGSPKKKKSLSDDGFDSEDDKLSTAAGSTATSDDELEDAPSYSRTVMMNYRAYCLASPASSDLSATMSRLQGLTVKDAGKPVRESYDDSRWACLRSSPGARNQVKRMETPPGLELPSQTFSEPSANDTARPWRTQAKASSTMPLSSPLVNPISEGLRPKRKF